MVPVTVKALKVGEVLDSKDHPDYPLEAWEKSGIVKKAAEPKADPKAKAKA